MFCSIPGVDPHVPHILWIEYEENWDDCLCQGWVWVQPRLAALKSFRKESSSLKWKQEKQEEEKMAQMRSEAEFREEKGTQTQSFWFGYLGEGWGSST